MKNFDSAVTTHFKHILYSIYGNCKQEPHNHLKRVPLPHGSKRMVKFQDHYVLVSCLDFDIPWL